MTCAHEGSASTNDVQRTALALGTCSPQSALANRAHELQPFINLPLRRRDTLNRSAASRPPVLSSRMSGKRSDFRRSRLTHVTGHFLLANTKLGDAERSP